MHRKFLTIAAALTSLLSAPRTQTRILPLGDSITESLSSKSSYRSYLWRSLRDAHYCVDFVGLFHGVAGGAPGKPDFDQQHLGYSGIASGATASALATHINSIPFFDVVLIHLGTNDFTAATPINPTQVITNLGSILTTLRGRNSSVKIFLAQIIPVAVASTTINANITTYNGLITTNATTTWLQTGSPIFIVDQNTGFLNDSNTTPHHLDDADPVHPNDLGEAWIAGNWFANFVANMPSPNSNSACFMEYGHGCPGNGGPAPTLVSTSIPVLGTTFVMTILNATTNTIGLLGTSDTNSGLGTLPLSMTSFGAPGCFLFSSGDSQTTLPLSGSSATWSISIPNNSGLLGAKFYAQASRPDTINSFGFVFSNAGRIRTGQ